MTLWTIVKPEFILGLMWSIGPIAYIWIETLKGHLDYFDQLVAQENIVDNPSVGAFLWLIVSFSAFIFGTAIASRSESNTRLVIWSDKRAMHALIVTFVVVTAVASLWMGVAIIKVGVGRMAAMAASDNLYAREQVLSASFPGGRIVSNGFMAITIFGALLLAMPRKTPLPKQQALMVMAIMALSLAYLGIAPILISGRINFFASIIASYIAVSLVRKRFVGIAYMPLGLVLLASVWTAKQYFSLSQTTKVGVFEQSWQGFLFYVYNDFVNAFAVIGNLNGNYTYGYFSARFVFFFTFTNKEILDILSANLKGADEYLGGGEFPLLTAPYVDFGAFGIIALILIGWIVKKTYWKTLNNPPYAAVYGLMAAGLALSLHSSYVTLQDPVFNMILLIYLINYVQRPDLRETKRLNRFKRISRNKTSTIPQKVKAFGR